jgi:hypothetical protein
MKVATGSDKIVLDVGQSRKTGVSIHMPYRGVRMAILMKLSKSCVNLFVGLCCSKVVYKLEFISHNQTFNAKKI